MSKKANPAKVGAFVLIGLTILVVTVAILGSSNLFSRPVRMVTYFRSSVNGLVQGSPVKFRGVTIGQVVNISLTIHSPGEALIPVMFDIDENSFRQKDGGDTITHPRQLEQAIENGLRSTLEMESFVTGRLYVSLDMYPDSEPAEISGDGKTPEIPSRRTGLEKLLSSLQDVDVAAMGKQLNEILDKLNASLAELNIKELNAKLDQLLSSADKLISSPKIIETVDSFRTTADKATEVLGALEKEIKPIGGNLKETTDAATAALNEMKDGVSDMRRILATESPVMSELTRALEEISDAARSLRFLSDELTRDPSVLIKGKPRPE